MLSSLIASPDDPALQQLCEQIAGGAHQRDALKTWPAESLQLCGQYGVYRWFAGQPWGGLAWSEADLLRGYLALGRSCLTTAFVLTQREGACRRIETGDNQELKERLLPALTRGDAFATVGISHLTTSRRHAALPALRARRTERGYVLDGYSAWVTGAAHADYVVVGAVQMDGQRATDQQILAAVPTNLSGVSAGPPAEMVALTGSATGEIQLNEVELSSQWLIAGPVENVLTSRGAGGGTGGLQTSTLALALSQSALGFLADESARRPDLREPLAALIAEANDVAETLFAAAAGAPRCSNDDLRQRANNLVLRSTHAALAAAKGAGFLASHPASRWCREALFFLVWSCPQGVVNAHLCELAGLSDDQ